MGKWHSLWYTGNKFVCLPYFIYLFLLTAYGQIQISDPSFHNCMTDHLIWVDASSKLFSCLLLYLRFQISLAVIWYWISKLQFLFRNLFVYDCIILTTSSILNCVSNLLLFYTFFDISVSKKPATLLIFSVHNLDAFFSFISLTPAHIQQSLNNHFIDSFTITFVIWHSTACCAIDWVYGVKVFVFYCSFHLLQVTLDCRILTIKIVCVFL